MPKTPINVMVSPLHVDITKKMVPLVNDIPIDATHIPTQKELTELNGEEPKKPIKREDPIIYFEEDAQILKGENAITYDQMIQIMKWETEDEYKERIKKEAGKDVIKAAKAAKGYGDNYLLRDISGRKIKCWMNTRNRPFEYAVAMSYAQDILHSGPLLPIEQRLWQFNGESFIIGNRGQVLSGQHRGAGFILAVQIWRSEQEKWKHIWPTEPVLELTLVTGVPEEQYIIKTIDNVRPRSLSDTIYTGDLFRRLSDKDKKECSRMLGTAIDVLWKRTGASSVCKYQTHGASADFLDRHKGLIDCILTIHDLNKDRVLSLQRLSPGRCAALKYLMGSSNSDSELYRSHRNEKVLNWSSEDKAQGFWMAMTSTSNDAKFWAAHADPDGFDKDRLAKGEDLKKQFALIREALGSIVDTDENMGGRIVEKESIIIKAWQRYSQELSITTESLSLEENYRTENGKTEFIDEPLIGGIDTNEITRVAILREDIENAKRIERATKVPISEVKPVVIAPPTANNVLNRDEVARQANEVRRKLAENAAKRKQNIQ